MSSIADFRRLLYTVGMGRRRKEIDETQTEEVSAQRRTLTIRLDDDGRLDTSSMRQQTLDSLKAALQDSNLFHGEAENETVAQFELKRTLYAQIVPALYAVLGSLESLVVARQIGMSYDDARRIFSYTDSDIALLQDPTATVLAKRMPEGFGWAEETTLILTLVSVHQQKLALLQEWKARNAKRVVNIEDNASKAQ